MEQKYWKGPVGQCNLCGSDFGKSMHDARTRHGAWANLCDACFEDEGCKAAPGWGQSYRKQPDGQWLKVAG